MAGSFGYEKEHYNLSMQIGELVLLPAVRQLADEVTTAAPGTSCRRPDQRRQRQKSLSSREILYDALLKN
jgi:hypothetical protein